MSVKIIDRLEIININDKHRNTFGFCTSDCKIPVKFFTVVYTGSYTVILTFQENEKYRYGETNLRQRKTVNTKLYHADNDRRRYKQQQAQQLVPSEFVFQIFYVFYENSLGKQKISPAKSRNEVCKQLP